MTQTIEIIPGVEFASANEYGVIDANGVQHSYADLSQAQLRKLAQVLKVGSGVWRVGAKKAEMIAAFSAVARGEQFDFSIAKPEPRFVQAAVPQPQSEEDRNHKEYAALLAVVNANVPAFLVGPPGTGKSTVASRVAKALGLNFYPVSISMQTSESRLLGYIDANGKPVRTALREAVEHGGLFLCDEIDNGNSNVLAVLNSILANDEVGFPDATVTKHKDFRFLATGNTWGTGANAQFVGRQQLDAATLDRFAMFWLGVDRRLDYIACGLPAPRPNPADIEYHFDPAASTVCAVERGQKWVKHVHAIQEAIERQSARIVVSRRAMQYGVRLLDAGLAWESVERMLLKKGLADDVWRRINPANN